LVVVRAKADRALTEERQRVDRLNEQVEALSVEVVRAEKQAEAFVGRAERAEAGRDAERARADELHHRLDDLTINLTDAHAELAAAQEAADALQQANAERRAKGRWARLRRAWLGE
jgi:uncharacterized coiled-coil DUF342 family protein